MDPADQVGTQGSVYSAMARYPVFSFKFRTAQHDVEVTLAGCRGTCVARMAGAVVHHLDVARLKRCAQLVFDFLPNGHFT